MVVEIKQARKAEFERQLDWHKQGGNCFYGNKYSEPASGSQPEPDFGSQPEPELELDLESSSESEQEINEEEILYINRL